MSAESGVTTFRDDLTQLWARYDAQRLATPETFHTDLDLVWGCYEWRRARVRRAKPNPGRLAVTAIEAQAPGCVVITQDVDDLHERAGCPAAGHLHGSLFALRCIAAADHPAASPDSAEEKDDDPGEGRRIPPPRCTRCGALVRLGVVWFGEQPPEAPLAAAVDAAAACDALLSVGTSGVVNQAAEIPGSRPTVAPRGRMTPGRASWSSFRYRRGEA